MEWIIIVFNKFYTTKYKERSDILTEVFWTFDHMLILQDYKDPMPHKHLAKHLIFGLDGNFDCIIKNEKISCSGVCIDSNIEHAVNSNGSNLLVFIFEETGSLSEDLDRNYLRGNPYCILDKSLVSTVVSEWQSNQNDSTKLDSAILSACRLYKNNELKYDDKISEVINILNDIGGIYEDTVNVLCEKIHLSKSKLSHLFKEQVGVSLSSYLVFEKMHKTYLYVLKGENIDDACVHAGFYSPSNFSAVFQEMFGLSFSNFIKKSDLKTTV